MRRGFILLFALLFLLCVGDAAAAPFVNGVDVQSAVSADWSWDAGSGLLTIKNGGSFAIEGWGSRTHPATGQIIVKDYISGSISLTLSDVHIKAPMAKPAVHANLIKDDSVSLTIGDNVTIVGSESGSPTILVGSHDASATISIPGRNVRIVGSDFGVYAQTHSGTALIDVSGTDIDIRRGDHGIFAYTYNGEASVRIRGNGVKVTEANFGIYMKSSYGDALIDVMGDDVTINANYSGMFADNRSGNTAVNVSGRRAVVGGGNTGIYAQSLEGSAKVMLGDCVTVKGGDAAAFIVGKENADQAKLFADGGKYPGINAEAGEDAENISFTGGPYYEMSGDLYSKVKDLKFLRTFFGEPSAGSLPKTGDESHLMLWGFLLALASAAALKRRAA